MKYRENPKITQVAAAAKVGISVRSGRTIEKKQHHTIMTLLPKIKTIIDGLDQKILSLYARGMSLSDIKGQLKDCVVLKYVKA